MVSVKQQVFFGRHLKTVCYKKPVFVNTRETSAPVLHLFPDQSTQTFNTRHMRVNGLYMDF